jgi:membrane protease YdiL (CAAX protease family)
MSVALPASPPRRRVRWGIGDAIWVAAVGFLAGNVAGVVSVLARHAPSSGQNVHLDSIDITVSSFAQFGAMLAMTFLLVRVKGWRGLADLGVGTARLADLRYVPMGVGAAIGLNLLVAPLNALWSNAGHGGQEIGKDLQRASGVTIAILFVVIVLVAPITEELLFRGIVLRSALRRMDVVAAVIVSGLAFGALHLLDPDTLPSLPALVAFGMLSAVVAVRTGRLAPSMGLHIGFNLLGAVALLATR